MVDFAEDFLSIRQQCHLLGVVRSTLYYHPIIDSDSLIANLIMEIYQQSDYRYGYRKISHALKNKHILINHKKVLGLMQEMNIQGLFPKRKVNTSKSGLNQCSYPYLLEGIVIDHPNQVWATDITYIHLPDRFMYFIAIIDLYSRYILSYDLSPTLEAGFCVEALKVALEINIPDIFNTDQGAQFTSKDFTSELQKRNIKISMDHKGRCFDNILIERLWRTLKQEAIFYYRPETVIDLEKCLEKFVIWYNNERLHQSLDYVTPYSVYYD